MKTSKNTKKTNALLNLLKEQNDIDKTYLYAKDLSKPRSEFLIKKRENVGIKPLKWFKRIYWVSKYNEWRLQEYW